MAPDGGGPDARPPPDPPAGTGHRDEDEPRPLLMFAWFLVCTGIAYGSTLRLPYVLDDLDVLDAVARYRSGQYDLATFLMLPHNEHPIPVMRLAFLGATGVAGLEALPFRLALCALHALAALGCAWAVRGLAGPAAAWLAGTLYAGASAFAGTPVFYPAASNFLVPALVGSLGVPAVLHGGAGPLGIAALLALGCGTNAGAVLLAATPIALCLRPPRGPARPRLAAGLAAAAVLTTLLVRGIGVAIHGRTAAPPPGLSVAGLEAGAFLVLTAPYRLLGPFLPFPMTQKELVLATSALAWVLAILQLVRMSAERRRLLLATWVGPVVFAVVIGLVRHAGVSWLGLLYTDRYYYPFLLPLSLHLAFALAGSPDSRLGRPWAAALGGLLFTLGHHRDLGNMPIFGQYATHAPSMAAAADLARRIDAAARAAPRPPLRFLDGWLPLPGVHKDRIWFAMPYYCTVPGGAARAVFAGAVTPAEARVQNRLLNRWAAGNGLSGPPVCAHAGTLSRATPVVDFRIDGYGDAIVSGFNHWERTMRWMEGTGRVRLTAAPGDLVVRFGFLPGEVRKLRAAPDGITVRVALADRPLGEVRVVPGPGSEVRLPVPAALLPPRLHGTPIEVGLTADLVWHPIAILPGNGDQRTLSVSVVALGFCEGRGLETPAPSPACPE